MDNNLRNAIREFRSTMGFFGFPLNDMTDEQIIEGTQAITEVVANAGITAKEASDVLVALLSTVPSIKDLEQK